MKKLLLYLVFLFYAFSIQAQVVRFVAPNASGNGSGLSAANAADFLRKDFWQDVQTLLAKQPVTVKFLGGDYERAYTEQFLSIENMGNAQHKLLLEADEKETIFTIPEGHPLKSQVIKIINSVNVTLKNFRFTGNGRIYYVLSITTTDPQKPTKNIIVENCKWENLRGVVYGGTGASGQGTQYVTFKNCSFKNLGLSAGSHMIYNAYGSRYISVINCYFEDCTGDYVRFRDKCDFGVVTGSTFNHKQKTPSIKFISMPLYNDGKPFEGNESFATNYSFTNNTFMSATPEITAFQFSNSGYSAVGFNYLLTAAEGEVLTNGIAADKKKLLIQNFGIDTDKVRVYNNSFKGLNGDIYLWTSAKFGAISKGWVGRGNMTNIINSNSKPFSWELLKNLE